ncbi:MAG: hypothetical protein KDC99_18525 [Cyclobacteriaceae bacterium]|nr:hypothetical protein [Cyclobacteriaceae bacterium]
MNRIVLILMFLVISLGAMAQPNNPSGDPDNPVPITGIEWLIGAGAILGARRLMNRKKER